MLKTIHLTRGMKPIRITVNNLSGSHFYDACQEGKKNEKLRAQIRDYYWSLPNDMDRKMYMAGMVRKIRSYLTNVLEISWLNDREVAQNMAEGIVVYEADV